MRTRIKIRYYCDLYGKIDHNTYFYVPQIKLHWWSKWCDLGHWWGNPDKSGNPTDYRICIIYTGTNCDTKERAQEYIDDLKKQGYLYKPTGIKPIFNDNFKGFFNE